MTKIVSDCETNRTGNIKESTSIGSTIIPTNKLFEKSGNYKRLEIRITQVTKNLLKPSNQSHNY